MLFRSPAWGSALCAGCQDPSKDALCAEYNGLDIQELNLCHLDGEYTFSLNSDDGSMLYINDRVIVDNGGSHYVQKKSGTIGLTAGYHKISLEYFESGDGKSVLEFDSAGCKLYSAK